MSEENQDEKKENPEEDKVEKAERILKETKEVLAKVETERSRLEKITANNIVSGRSEAGTAPPEVKEETPEEYAKKVMSGEQ